MDGVWWISAASLGVSLVCTPIVRHIAYRLRIVDRPDDLLKPHARPVAYLGGVAMCLGLLAGLACYAAVMPGRLAHSAAIRDDLAGLRLSRLADNPLWNLLAVAVAGIVITIVGLMDDLRDIKPRTKVYGQVLAAAILLLGGVGTRMALVGLNPFGLAAPDWVLVPLSAVVCVVVVIGACNATNLLDGLDGLCGGVTAIIALGFLALAVHLAMYPHVGPHGVRVALCLAMAGAVLGFLPYNIPPASIFMGDAGSMLLGFFVAVMMALFCREGNARWFVASGAVFALPIVDTGLAVVRRLLARKSIFAGDRSHLYDQLVDRGMSVKQVVVLFYALAAAAALVGVLLAIYLRGRYALVVYAVSVAILGGVFYKLGMVTPESRPPHGPKP